jgi:hypothetical protein
LIFGVFGVLVDCELRLRLSWSRWRGGGEMYHELLLNAVVGFVVVGLEINGDENNG